MTRLIEHKESRPVEIKIGNDSKWICQCGLSNHKPYCDGSHKQCSGEEEGKVYRYKEGKREEIQ